MSRRLRKSEVRSLDEQLPISLDKKDEVVVEGDELLINDVFSFLLIDDQWVPALPLLLKQELLPVVVVDMGAVRFVVNGADVMRPGIIQLPDVDKNTFVVVVDERNKKPLAVGRMLLSGEDARASSSGKVVANVHFVSDEHWKKYSN